MQMTENDADASIVRTVIDLAHNLGKQVWPRGGKRGDVEASGRWAAIWPRCFWIAPRCRPRAASLAGAHVLGLQRDGGAG